MADSVGSVVFPRTGIQEGHTHFDKDNNILYVYNGGDPSNVNNWSSIGGSGAPVSGGKIDVNTTLYVYDDFISGGNLANQIGALGWQLFSGGGSVTAGGLSPADHPGIFRLTTTGGAPIGLTLGADRTVRPQELFDIRFLFRLTQVAANTIVQAGLMFGTDPTDTNNIYFEKLAGDINWFAKTQAGGAPTRTDTGVAVDTSFILMRVRRIDALSIGFTINGGTEVVHTTTIPSAIMDPTLYIDSDIVSAKVLEVDFFDMEITITR